MLDIGNLDNEGEKRKEYEQLLKRYRNAEADRKSYARDTAAIIKKQR